MLADYIHAELNLDTPASGRVATHIHDNMLWIRNIGTPSSAKKKHALAAGACRLGTAWDLQPVLHQQPPVTVWT